MNTKLAHLGVVLLVLGAALLLTPSFGFETIAADRPLDVGTADDENATVGFEETDDAIDGRDDSATVFWLRNNAQRELALTNGHMLSISGLEITEDGQVVLPSGERTPVSVACGTFGASDTATLTTTVHEALNDSLTVRDASSTTSFLANCTVPSLVWDTDDDWSTGAERNRTVSDDVGDREPDTVRLGYDADESGLVGYWPLDEDSGSTASDATGNGNDGTHVNGPTIGAPGVLNTSAYEFEAANDEYVEVPDSNSLQVGDSVSVSAWVKIDEMQDHREWTAIAQKSNQGYNLWLHYGDNPMFTINDGEDQDVWGPDDLVAGTWYHLVGTYDGDTARIYVDGEETGSQSGIGQMDTGTVGVGIGENLVQSGRQFDGAIEELRIYDHGLSSSEVEELYDTAADGNRTTAWRDADAELMADALYLENVSASLAGTDATAYVESDTDGDGVVDETSDPIALADGDEYAVTGLENDTDRVRLRVELATTNVSRTPIVSRADLTEKHPHFDVEIDDTNSPVVETETLNVDVTVTNTGYDPDDQTIELEDLGGSVVDSQTVSLDPGASQSLTLSWSTQEGDGGAGTVDVTSDDDTDATNVTVQRPADLQVAVDDTNSPVEAGGVVAVDATVSNDGDATGTQQITLTTDGVERDVREVTLDGGASQSIALEWPTGTGDVGIYDALVESDDDSATVEVSVYDPDGLRWETDSDWSDGATLDRTVSDDVGDRENDTVRLGYDTDESGLVGYWPLDEDSGSAAYDATANGNDGTLSGDPTQGKTGILDSTGYGFDGSGDYVTVGHDDALELSDENRVTVSAWVKMNSEQGTYSAIAQKSNTAYNLQFAETNTPTFTISSGDNSWENAYADMDTDTEQNTGINTGQWYHLVGTYDGTDVRIYVDGQQRGTETASQIADASDYGIGVGRNLERADADNPRDLDGDVDELRIYDRALSAEEVQDLYETTDRGNHTTAWQPTGDALDADHLKLENVSVATGAQDATVYVESDTDHDGTVDETSDGIALADGTQQYDVAGLSTDLDRVRLRVEFDTGDVTRTPIVSDVTLGEKSYFDVAINSTNSPVRAGETLSVDATVANEGQNERTKTVTLDTDGKERSGETVTLSPGESTSVTLEWPTDESDVGYHDATVATDDDSETVEIGVYDPDGLTWATDADWSDGAARNRTVSDDVGDRESDTARLGYPADSSGLVSYWPLDEDSGSTATDVAGGNDGQHSGDGITLGERGLLNTSRYQFDGTSHINVSDDPSLRLTGDFAISFWVRPVADSLGSSDNDQKDQTFFVDKSTYETNGYQILDNGVESNQIIFRVNDNGNAYDATFPRSDINDGNWHQITAVRDGTEIRLYRNETLESSVSNTAIVANNGQFAIAGTSDVDGHLDGDMDELRVYDRALSDAEVQQLYQTTSDGNHTTAWRPTGGPLNASKLQLENVSVATGGQNATAYVESDTDHDGTVDETSHGIALADGTQQYDVTGLPSDPDRVRLRVEYETGDLHRTPIVDRVEFSEKRPTFDVAIDGTNASVTEGDDVDVDVDVTNLDDREDTQTIELRNFEGDVVDQTDVALGAGENDSVTLTWATQGGDEGTGDVTVASPDRSAAQQVTVEDGSQFDVTIDETNEPVVEGEDLTVNATVTNNGTVTDTETVELTDFDGDVVDSADVTLAPDGASESITLTWSTQTGEYGTGDVTVDSGDDSATSQVTVERQATFDVAIEETNSPVIEGEDLTVDVNVTNVGDVQGTQTVELVDFDGDVEDAREVTLASGASNSSVTLTWSTQSGDGRTDDVTVSSEDASVTKTVTVEQPEYFDVAIDGTNSAVEEGQDLTVDVNVTNTGDHSGTQTIELWDFGGTVVDSTEVTLASGASNSSITLVWSTSEGDAGSGDVTVSSENTSAARSVTVETPGPAKVTNVAPNVNSGEDTQYFEMELASDMGSQFLRMNVSKADNSEAMDYGSSPTVTVVQGGDYVSSVEWKNYASNDLTGPRITLNDQVSGGEIVNVSVSQYTTQSSGGPWTVEYMQENTDETWYDDFRIEG